MIGRMQTSEKFGIKLIGLYRLAAHYHLQFVDRKDMNIGTKGNQLTGRPVTIAARLVENIYTLTALKQIRDQLKRTNFFTLIILVFQPVIAHFSCFPVLNCCCPKTASHINPDTYLVLDLTFSTNAITFSLHFELLFLRLCESLLKVTRQRSSLLFTPAIVCHLYMVSFR